MRALVQANPKLLPQLMRETRPENADLLRLIQENEREFLEFLKVTITVEPAKAESLGYTEEVTPGGRLPEPRHHILTVNVEKGAADNCLKAFQFPEELVTQACPRRAPLIGLEPNQVIERKPFDARTQLPGDLGMCSFCSRLISVSLMRPTRSQLTAVAQPCAQPASQPTN
ncbi:DNA repair protein [Fasciola hepatica]|uniref:DNA repair protein n=1 Tax=Fasciola hepatica TaxID=6192 RepID=A0A2H1C7H7_FASHE|nr:DNA repair protein [Fasciola hepatica]